MRDPIWHVTFRSAEVMSRTAIPIYFALLYSMTEKTQFSEVHVSPGNTETLVSRGATTNHLLIAHSPSNISAKIIKFG